MADSFTRILVVDDTDEIRCMVSIMLSHMGYEVLSTVLPLLLKMMYL
jgi:CheY-like chemotaxis protein